MTAVTLQRFNLGGNEDQSNIFGPVTRNLYLSDQLGRIIVDPLDVAALEAQGWLPAVSDIAGGNNTDIQFNNLGALAGDDSFTYQGNGAATLGKAGVSTGDFNFVGITSGK